MPTRRLTHNWPAINYIEIVSSHVDDPFDSRRAQRRGKMRRSRDFIRSPRRAIIRS